MKKYLDIFSKNQIKKINGLRESGGKKFEKFSFGDTITVTYKNVENIKIGGRKDPSSEQATIRTQSFSGVCIGIHNNGDSTTFIVRKIIDKEGSYQKSFMLYAPIIESIEVVKYGKVRRAKLYYLNTLYGKAARIKEKKFVKVAKAAI